MTDQRASRRPLIDRVVERLEVTMTGCWVGGGYGNKRDGYRRLGGSSSGERWLVHRFMWTFYNGPVPEGLELDHLCRNRACCNPDHLEPVTRMENVRRGLVYRPAACPAGHTYTPENSMLTKMGHLKCRECDRRWNKEKYQRRKEASRG